MTTFTQQYNEARLNEPGLSVEDFESRQAGPAPVSTVNEPAPTAPTGNVVQRDFEREQSALKKMGISQALMGTIDPAALFEATYSPGELEGLSQYQDIKSLGQAKADLAATPRPTNSTMGVLEEALRTKSDVGDQPLGQSDLFSQAGLPTKGVSAYTTLNQSLQQHGQEMKDRYGSFVNQMSKTSGSMADAYNTVADRYKLLNDSYNQEADRMQRLTEIMTQHENAMEILQKQSDLDNEVSDMFGDGGAAPSGPGSSLLGDYTDIFMGSPMNADGIDLVANKGTKVTSSGFGTVVFAGPNGGWGNQVKIEDDQGNIHQYSHLDSINAKVGDGPGTGDVIGTFGNTGNVLTKDSITGDYRPPTDEERAQGRGTHLDYTVYKPDGSKYTVEEAAKFAGIGEKTQTGFGENFEALLQGALDGEISDASFKQAISDLSEQKQVQMWAELSRRRTNTGLTPKEESEIIAATAAVGKMVYGTRISESETPRIEKLIKLDIEQNGELDRWRVIKQVLGFNPTSNEEMGDDLLALVNQYVDDGLNDFDVMGLSTLLSNNKKSAAINKVEKFIMAKARVLEEGNYIGESNVVAATKRVNKVEKIMNELGRFGNPVGEFSGTFEEWIGKFKGADAQKIATNTMQLVKEFANEFMGANMTEQEKAFYSPIIPELGDDIDNFMIKLNSLKEDPLLRVNSIRSTYGLPELTEEALLDKEARVGLYEPGEEKVSIITEDGKEYLVSAEDARIAVEDEKVATYK